MRRLLNERYRVDGVSTRWAVILAAICLVGIAAGCTGFAEEVRPTQEEARQENMETATRLYESMVAVFQTQTEGVDIEFEEQLTVISHFEDVGQERRRRFVGTVVPLGGGIGVKVTAEYQVETDEEGEDVMWKDEPRESIEEEAEPDELRIARSVERLFNQGGP